MTIASELNAAYSRQADNEAEELWFPRPSALGGCLREMAFLISGARKEPRSPESMRVLELGNQRGAELARRAKEIWPTSEAEKEVEIPFRGGSMRGHIDLWLPDERTIVDFKTAGAYSMGLVVSGEKQDEGYALQLNAYRHGIHAMLGIPLADIRTLLVYEAKDSDARKSVTAGMLVEQEIPYSQELEDAYNARLGQIAAIMASATNPEDVPGMPKEKGKPHWRCRCAPDGRPMYCSIGPTRGNCK